MGVTGCMDVSHVRGQLGARIIGRQVLFEQIFQTHPIQDVVHQGKPVLRANNHRSEACTTPPPFRVLPGTLRESFATGC